MKAKQKTFTPKISEKEHEQIYNYICQQYKNTTNILLLICLVLILIEVLFSILALKVNTNFCWAALAIAILTIGTGIFAVIIKMKSEKQKAAYKNRQYVAQYMKIHHFDKKQKKMGFNAIYCKINNNIVGPLYIAKNFKINLKTQILVVTPTTPIIKQQLVLPKYITT